MAASQAVGTVPRSPDADRAGLALGEERSLRARLGEFQVVHRACELQRQDAPRTSARGQPRRRTRWVRKPVRQQQRSTRQSSTAGQAAGDVARYEASNRRLDAPAAGGRQFIRRRGDSAGHPFEVREAGCNLLLACPPERRDGHQVLRARLCLATLPCIDALSCGADEEAEVAGG